MVYRGGISTSYAFHCHTIVLEHMQATDEAVENRKKKKKEREWEKYRDGTGCAESNSKAKGISTLAYKPLNIVAYRNFSA